jgi:Flagellar biosynthesis protein, FliO
MSSTLPIQQPYFPAPRFAGADSHVANSFAKTLRAFAEKQQLDPSIAPLPSAAAEPEKKRTRPMGTPLTMGISAAKATQAPAAPQPSEAVAEKENPPQPRSTTLISRAWTWLQKSNRFSNAKQLRVAETVSLGEKRFVALIDVEGQKFLVGGGASGVSLLTQLDSAHAADSVQPNAGAGELLK